jgi:transposase
MLSKEERLEIGRQLYAKELTRFQAEEKYSISYNTLTKCLTEYKTANGIPLQEHKSKSVSVLQEEGVDIERYREMSKDELIDELIKAKANELRAKKGYEVKGSGAEKEFSILKDKNSK